MPVCRAKLGTAWAALRRRQRCGEPERQGGGRTNQERDGYSFVPPLMNGCARAPSSLERSRAQPHLACGREDRVLKVGDWKGPRRGSRPPGAGDHTESRIRVRNMTTPARPQKQNNACQARARRRYLPRQAGAPRFAPPAPGMPAVKNSVLAAPASVHCCRARSPTARRVVNGWPWASCSCPTNESRRRGRKRWMRPSPKFPISGSPLNCPEAGEGQRRTPRGAEFPAVRGEAANASAIRIEFVDEAVPRPGLRHRAWRHPASRRSRTEVPRQRSAR